MRKLAPFLLFLGISCTTSQTAPAPDAATPATAGERSGPYGMTVAEEARILALEDRREYDPALTAQWVRHENSLHRRRIALALGRIGAHTFVDANSNGDLDSTERRAGVAELIALAADPDRTVREAVAFSLGEIGDPFAADALFSLTTDADASVAAEAIEALSKLASNPEFLRERMTRYLWLTDAQWPEGLRARATRFLFRFENQSALEAATTALASTSPAVRQEAAFALSRRPHENARGQLELLLSDPGVLTRAYAAAALGRIANAASVPALVASLGDIHPWVRTNAAVALGRVFEKTPAAAAGRAADLPRVFAALEDADPGVRISTIDFLGFYAAQNYQDARVRLLDRMSNGTQAEREAATRAVMRHLSANAFNSKYPTDPWQIIRVMEGYGRGPFFRDMYLKHESALVRANVASQIPDDLIDAEIEKVRTLMNDPDVIVRASAIERYGKSKFEDTQVWATTLEEAERRERNAPMNDARLAAIAALADRYRPQRPAFLRGLLSDPDPIVRRTAADLIVEKLSARRPQYTPLPVNRTQAEYESIVRWSRQPHTATIHMTRGKIELILLPQEAPMTAWNFAQLAQKKFFDNTSFMRVVPNFVIQGGDPRNDMNGGPGYAIRDEINLQKYTRGAVGMALSGPDTGGSQFFITHSQQPHLDGGYTIFARVADGMSSVVDQTERGDKVTTITIDERPPGGADQLSAVPNVTLPLVIGALTREQIVATVPSYGERSSEYKPDLTVLEMMKSYVRAGDRLEVYMGTWCDDSQREVPKFLRISDDLKSQFGVDLPATFIAVDRSKQQPAALLEGKSVDKIATFIYYRDGQELGRIVERPSSLFEDDLLTIVAKQK